MMFLIQCLRSQFRIVRKCGYFQCNNNFFKSFRQIQDLILFHEWKKVPKDSTLQEKIQLDRIYRLSLWKKLKLRLLKFQVSTVKKSRRTFTRPFRKFQLFSSQINKWTQILLLYSWNWRINMLNMEPLSWFAVRAGIVHVTSNLSTKESQLESKNYKSLSQGR